MPKKMTNIQEETREVTDFARGLGATLVGVADLSLYRDDYGNARPLLDVFPWAISVAIRLSSPIIDGITEVDPTPIYAHHYRTVNALLDDIAIRLTNYCQAEGHQALPIPASQTVDEDNFFGAISHKAIAVLAGLGWQGRSLLVINRELGPRIRLVTILTTLPLSAALPLENECGDCLECAEACPVGAIKGISFKLKPSLREEALDTRACAQRTRKFGSNLRYGSNVCGICIKVCPFGRKTCPQTV